MTWSTLVLLALASHGFAAEPPAELEQSLRNIAEHYMSDMDEGRFEYAYAWLSPEYQARISLPDFTAEVAKFNAMAGPVRSRTISRVTLRVDDPRAGTIADLDVVSRFARIDRHCSVVTLSRAPNGSAFRVLPPANDAARGCGQSAP